MPETAALLDIRALEASYGSTQVLWDVNLHVAGGEVVTLIGGNGAGKTTIMNAISGLIRPTGGAVLFDGADLARRRPEDIVRAGISHVPEGRQVFGSMSVEENLLVGAYTVSDKAAIEERFERSLEMFPRLRERRHQAAGTMSGGEQQMLAIARGLMSQPRLLLLDEPSLGLAPRIVTEVFRALRAVVDTGMTVLLVEQNSRVALKFADRAYVLETGRVGLSGPADELQADDRVKALYLGGSTAPPTGEPVPGS